MSLSELKMSRKDLSPVPKFNLDTQKLISFEDLKPIASKEPVSKPFPTFSNKDEYSSPSSLENSPRNHDHDPLMNSAFTIQVSSKRSPDPSKKGE